MMIKTPRIARMRVGILMVLITSLCVVDLDFFFMNFREGAADIVS